MSDELSPEMLEEAAPDLLTLEDEDGKEVTFEVIDATEVNGTRYLAVIPYQEDPESLQEDAELILMRIGTDDEGEYMDIVDDDEELITVGKVFEERRNYLVERMNQIDGVSCLKPDGAFYVMMNLEKLIGRTLGGRVIHNADDFAMAFLEKGLVAVVSCCAFDAPNFVRWTYATSLDTIKEGLDRLEKFLKEG